jgi:hypothetical protein
VTDSLATAIAKIKAGNRAGGRDMLVRLLHADPANETAWLWLAAVVGNMEQRRYCLERALRLNPHNAQAKTELAKLIVTPAPVRSEASALPRSPAPAARLTPPPPIRFRFTRRLRLLLLSGTLGLLLCGLAAWFAVPAMSRWLNPSAQWHTHTAPDGSFAVQMPGQAKVATHTVTVAETATEIHTLSLALVSQAYNVSYLDLPTAPDASAEEILNLMRDGAVADVGGQLLSERAITLGQYPGKEVLIQVPNSPMLKGRFFIVGAREYALVAAPAGDPDTEKFLESFHLLTP